MWAMALVIYASLKLITWRLFVAGMAAPPAPPARRSVAYLIGWPGLDAHAFFASHRMAGLTSGREFIAAIGKAAVGAAMIWAFPRALVAAHPMLAGWCVMVGLVLLLHFGALQLIC